MKVQKPGQISHKSNLNPQQIPAKHRIQGVPNQTDQFLVWDEESPRELWDLTKNNRDPSNTKLPNTTTQKTASDHLNFPKEIQDQPKELQLPVRMAKTGTALGSETCFKFLQQPSGSSSFKIYG